jgi:TonB-linked SusC/RagA family outer membrane protein
MMGHNFKGWSIHKMCRCVFNVRFVMVSLLLLMQFPAMYALKEKRVDEVDQQPGTKITVTGQVVEENGATVPGASIIIEGTSIGTITDMDGNYSLKGIDPNAVIVVSFIGFGNQSTKISGRTVINFTLKPDVEQLDEVVVQVGYGSVKRVNMLGAVADISSKKIEDVVMPNLTSTLEGRMAGVIVEQTSGVPGASASIKIRTSGSWNNEPILYVIDGFIREDPDAFNVLDASEIESISVLKDAAAAVYGVRASGGVIVVTTKKGKEGKVKINYTGNVGVSDANYTPQLMSAYDHAIALNDMAWGKYNWNKDDVTNNPDKLTYFGDSELEQLKSLDENWLKYGWKSAMQTRHSLNASGGTEKVKYFVGGNYLNQNGNFENLNMTKYGMRMGLDMNFGKGWKMNFGLSGNNKTTHTPYNAADKEPDKMYNTYSTLLRTPKWIPPYINGLPVGQTNTVKNHVLLLNDMNSFNESFSNDMIANLGLEWDLPWVKGLKAKTTYNYSTVNSGGLTYAKPYYLYNFETEPSIDGNIPTNILSATAPTTYVENGDKYSQSANTTRLYQWNVSLNYNAKFGLHDISVLGIYEQSLQNGIGLNGTVENMIIDNVLSSEAFGQGISPVFNGEESTPVARLGYIGRLNYSYAGRYLLESTVRYDASSKFAPADRWGVFPSVSLGWRISEESFFKNGIDPSVMDDLKLRLSMGVVGGDNNNPLSWEENYQYSGSYAYLGGSTKLGGIMPYNSGISLNGTSWEKTNTYNGGIDARFFNKLTFGGDAFFRHTYDILTVRSSALSYTNGITTQMPKENYGIQESWGVEVSLGFEDKISTDWNYSIKGNLSYATSKVIKKYQADAIIGTWKDEEGRIRGGETGYTSLGIMQQSDVDAILAANPTYTIFGSTPEAGMLNFKDVGGADYSNEPDGKIDENDERIISKYDTAPYHYGLSIGFGWRDLRLDATFSGQFGNDIFYDKAVYTTGSGNRSTFDWLSGTSNNLTLWNDHWTPENTDAAMPRLDDKGKSKYRSTFWMVDGHTLTMRTMSLSYTLPKGVSKRLGIGDVRMYFSGNNLWTIINPLPYKDPGLSSWMDYPIMRSFNFGLNLNI